MPVVLRFENLHKAYGGRVLLDAASAALTGEHRWGLIGRNGCGKSTLVRLLLGQEEAEGGTIWQHPDLRLGYLEQHDPFHDDETLVAFLERFSGRPDWRCAAVAARFGLGNERLDEPVRSLSGGYQTRTRLAAMLLCEPDFLVLDEPTNFLDLRTQMLLERFLADWQGGALVVSHDRDFLAAVCDRTLAIEGRDLIAHPGPVGDWLTARQMQREQTARRNAAIESKRRQLQRFVDSNRANANTASQARSKQKQIDRLQTVAAFDADSTVRLRLPAITARSGVCLRTNSLTIGYFEHPVANGVDLEVDHGTRVAVVGDNGQGKTTLVRTLCGDLQPLTGTLRWGHGCTLGTYAQHVYRAIPESCSVESYLSERAGPDIPRQEVLDIAGSFLFSGDDVSKPVAVLSGGERARLCLAGLLLARPTVMLLDEPTNHLDVETVDALTDALADYQGTVILVSHERSFLQKLATAVIEVGDGRVRHYPGTWEEYCYRVRQECAPTPPPEPAAEGQRISDGKRLHLLTKRSAAAERTVQRLEAELYACEGDLQTADPAEAQAAQAAIAELRSRLETAETEWYAVQEELEGG